MSWRVRFIAQTMPKQLYPIRSSSQRHFSTSAPLGQEHRTYFQNKNISLARPMLDDSTPRTSENTSNSERKSGSMSRVTKDSLVRVWGVLSATALGIGLLSHAMHMGWIPGLDPGQLGACYRRRIELHMEVEQKHREAVKKSDPQYLHLKKDQVKPDDALPQPRNDQLQSATMLSRSTLIIAELKDELARSRDEVQLSDSANKRTHRLLVDIVFSQAPSRVVRDDGLIENPPEPIPAETGIDSSNATLLRIVDSRSGKDRALILGLDGKMWNLGENPTEHPFRRLVPAIRWLHRLSRELYVSDQTVDRNAIPLYVWLPELIVENSIDADRPNFLPLLPADVPPGFPITQMKAIEGIPLDKGNAIKQGRTSLLLTSGKR